MIGVATRVDDGNHNDKYFDIVVAERSNSSEQRDDVSLTKVVDSLVLVSESLTFTYLLLPLLLGLLKRLKCLWAAKEHDSNDNPSCIHRGALTLYIYVSSELMIWN